MKKLLMILTVLVVTLAFAISALALKPPVIALERVEVATMQAWHLTAKVTEPDKKDPKKKVEKVGKQGYSSIINLAYILNIKNPNKEPLMLDELSFTTTFDGFEVNTVTSYEDAWVPGGKTNQLRVIATNEAFPTLLGLLVGAINVKRMKEMKTTGPALVKKWWTSVQDFSFPIELTNGTALFQDEKGKELRATFTGKFGKAKAKAKK